MENQNSSLERGAYNQEKNSRKNITKRSFYIGLVVAIITVVFLAIYQSALENDFKYFESIIEDAPLYLFYFSAFFGVPIILAFSIIGFIINLFVSNDKKALFKLVSNKYSFSWFISPWVLFGLFWITGESQGSFDYMGGMYLIMGFALTVIVSLITLLIGIIIGRSKLRKNFYK